MSWKVNFFKTTRGEQPVREFIKKQEKPLQTKIAQSLQLLIDYGPYIKPPYNKKIQDKLYELRISGKVAIRIFYTFVNSEYYILHAFIDRQASVNMPMMGNMQMMMGNFYQSFTNQSIIFFFAMFMLIEPKTNPAAGKQRIFYGILAAVMLIGIETYNPVFGIPFVLAIANLFVPLLNRIIAKNTNN